MIPLNRIVLAALAAGVLASGASAARGAPAPPAGDPAGIELAQKVNAYYAAPARMGIEMRSALPGGLMSVKIVLARGRTMATVVSIAMGKERATTVLTPRGAFMREPGSRCWTKLGAGVTDDSPMIILRNARFLAPESIGALTRLEVVDRDPATRATMRTVYKIDAATGRIASLVSEGMAITVKTLPRAPAVPAHRPVCKA